MQAMNWNENRMRVSVLRGERAGVRWIRKKLMMMKNAWTMKYEHWSKTKKEAKKKQIMKRRNLITIIWTRFHMWIHYLGSVQVCNRKKSFYWLAYPFFVFHFYRAACYIGYSILALMNKHFSHWIYSSFFYIMNLRQTNDNVQTLQFHRSIHCSTYSSHVWLHSITGRYMIGYIFIVGANHKRNVFAQWSKFFFFSFSPLHSTLFSRLSCIKSFDYIFSQ